MKNKKLNKASGILSILLALAVVAVSFLGTACCPPPTDLTVTADMGTSAKPYVINGTFGVVTVADGAVARIEAPAEITRIIVPKGAGVRLKGGYAATVTINGGTFITEPVASNAATGATFGVKFKDASGHITTTSYSKNVGFLTLNSGSFLHMGGGILRLEQNGGHLDILPLDANTPLRSRPAVGGAKFNRPSVSLKGGVFEIVYTSLGTATTEQFFTDATVHIFTTSEAMFNDYCVHAGFSAPKPTT